jgi:hypothetical protein
MCCLNYTLLRVTWTDCQTTVVSSALWQQFGGLSVCCEVTAVCGNWPFVFVFITRDPYVHDIGIKFVNRYSTWISTAWRTRKVYVHICILLDSWVRVPVVAQLTKKLPHFIEPSCPSLIPILSQMNPVHVLRSCVFNNLKPSGNYVCHLV